MNPFLSFFLFLGVVGRPYPPIWTYNYGIRPSEPQYWQDVAPAPVPSCPRRFRRVRTPGHKKNGGL
jgi:hypothetical protein